MSCAGAREASRFVARRPLLLEFLSVLCAERTVRQHTILHRRDHAHGPEETYESIQQQHRNETRHQEREDAANKPAANSTVGQETYDRVLRHVANGNYPKALDLLRSAGREPRLRNAIGVCLMRLGRTDEAVRIYRDLVLTAGCTWLRPDIPLVYSINYATSLALAGHPAGCLEILSDLNADEHPVVQDLRARSSVGRRGCRSGSG